MITLIVVYLLGGLMCLWITDSYHARGYVWYQVILWYLLVILFWFPGVSVALGAVLVLMVFMGVYVSIFEAIYGEVL